MGFFNSFFNRRINKTAYRMITDNGNGFYSWDGKLYKSDIVRACIRPYAKSLGKLAMTHVRESNGDISVNPEPYIRRLLQTPNSLMSGQVLIEKAANQLALNNNAFILILRDDFDCPYELYPIPAIAIEAVYQSMELFLKFYFQNGKQMTVPYADVIHIRNDFFENDIFGESPKEALESLMEIVTVTDQGIVKAVKNSNAIRWLLKFSNSMKKEHIKQNVQDFVDNYLNIDNSSVGAAGVDAKADIQRIEPKDYVPNASQLDRTTQRIYSFFNTNEKIVHSTATEDDWNTYFELVIEPTAIQFSNEFTNKIFTSRERGCGNKIYFDASNLQNASFQTKLSLEKMVDRGALTPNEWRAAFNLSPIPGGDTPIRRLDTAQVNVYKEGEGGDDE